MTRTHEKLTHKEHAARAMLLGLLYDWRDGTYCDGNVNDGGPNYNGRLLSCDNLCVVTVPESEDRARLALGMQLHQTECKWHLLEKETPWARMDDDE